MDTAPALTSEEADRLVELVQELQSRLEAMNASPTREVGEQLVSAVVQMYGAGLEQVVGRLMAAGDEGRRIAAELVEDPLLATLLLIHDLHPIPLTERVQGALDSVRPYMESHGGNVKLLSIEDGVARIHLQGSCSDCSASSVTLELAIKQALEDAAPDLEGLEVEGVAPQTPGLALPMANRAPTGMELPIVMSQGAVAPPPSSPAWFEVESAGEVADGALAAVTVAGSELVIANVDGTLLAYRDACADCGDTIRDGRLDTGALQCSRCGRSYFLPRAGRSMDDDHLQLEPVPLLSEQGRVKVALAAG